MKFSYLAEAMMLGFFSLAAAGITDPEDSQAISINKTGTVLLSNQEFNITCSGCTALGDLSLSGGNSPDFLPDANFSSLPFDFSQTWVGAAVDDFHVHLELTVNLTPTNPTNEVVIHLLDEPLTLSRDIADLVTMSWTLDPQLHGWVNATAPVSFSFGFDFVIPPHSAVWIPVDSLDNITTIGFSQSTLTPIPFTSTDKNPNFAFELGFRPVFSVNASFPFGIDPVFAEVSVDVPKVDVEVTQISNVNRNCEPVSSAGTSSDQIFNNLTHVSASISFDIDFDATEVANVVEPIGNVTLLPTTCLAYSPQKSALGAVPATSLANGKLAAPALRALGLVAVVVVLLL